MLKKAHSPIFFVSALFLLSFFIRFYLADFEKMIVFYPDELRYYQIAENISRGDFLIINNAPVTFQKILYSLFLAPIFLFENAEIKAHLFTALNAFLVSSVVFPTYLIGKLLLQKQTNNFTLCFLSILLSDLAYSVTFMSEVLFLPLGMWGIYFSLRIIIQNRTNILFSVLFGILIYAIYLCKEIGAVFLLALFFYVLFARLFKLETNFKAQIQNIIIISIVFFLVFTLFKLTFFSGFGNTYAAQIHFSIFGEQGRWAFLFYGFFYYLMNIVVAGLFFIFFLPIVYFKYLNIHAKKLYIFVCCIIFVSSAVVAFTVTVREDFAREFPRAHLRYLVYIWVPMLAIFLSLIEKNCFTNIFLKQKIILFFFSFVLMAFYLGANPVGDHTMLAFIHSENRVLIFKIFLLIALFVFIHFYQKRRYFCIGFLIFFAVIQFFNNRHTIKNFKPFYQVQEKEKMQIKKVQDFIKKQPNKTFLIADKIGTRSQSAADTFLNEKHVTTVYFDSFQKNMDDFANIDYFIFSAENHFSFKKAIPKNDLNGVLWQVFENPR